MQKMQKVALIAAIFSIIQTSSVLGDPLSCVLEGRTECACILTLKAQDCKKTAPVIYEIKKHYFSTNDFNYRCDSIGNLSFDFFNSSKKTITEIVIEGATFGTRLSESVLVPPGKSKYVFVLSSGAFCRKEKKARLYFEHRVAVSGGECLARYSSAELQRAQSQCKGEAERKRDEEIIYNNCIVSKSQNVDSATVFRSVRSVCREISRNPTMLQRWRWGN